MTHPQHPDHLQGSKWTAQHPENRELHWVVAAFAPVKGVVTLEAVLTGRRQDLPWRALRDREVWLAGWVSRSPRQVLVVGGGLAGLTCAGALAEAGWSVTVVDKGRGPGGRSSTRRAGGLRFDHGAQSFDAEDPRFAAAVEAWEADGLLARWEGRVVRLRPGEEPVPVPGERRRVGVPGMSGPIEALAQVCGVRFGLRIVELTRAERGWRARAESGEELGPFEQVVIATPAPQAVPLLEPVAPDMAARAAGVEVAPCWATLVAFAEPLPVDWDGARVEGSPLAWVAHDSSKPERPKGDAACWVLHASEAWSRENVERSPESVAAALLAALGELVHQPLPETVYLTAHRWRYAFTTRPLGEAFLHDPALGLSVCGDGCLGPGLEDAYLSGLALGERLVAAPAGA